MISGLQLHVVSVDSGSKALGDSLYAAATDALRRHRRHDARRAWLHARRVSGLLNAERYREAVRLGDSVLAAEGSLTPAGRGYVLQYSGRAFSLASRDVVAVERYREAIEIFERTDGARASAETTRAYLAESLLRLGFLREAHCEALRSATVLLAAGRPHERRRGYEAADVARRAERAYRAAYGALPACPGDEGEDGAGRGFVVVCLVVGILTAHTLYQWRRARRAVAADDRRRQRLLRVYAAELPEGEAAPGGRRVEVTPGSIMKAARESESEKPYFDMARHLRERRKNRGKGDA